MRDAAAARGRIAMRASALAAGALAAAFLLAAPARAQRGDDACSKVSPSASFCIGLQKLAEAAAAECRHVGRPPSDCNLPLGHAVADDITRHYANSWLHRAAAFQSQIGDPLPFARAQWLGTHNSFNSPSDGSTASHTDSNQQLSLRQQLDIDMRSLELDLHWLKGGNADGSNAVVVCHGRGPDQANFGCTNEPRLKEVLPQIADWLNDYAHHKEVLLRYFEDSTYVSATTDPTQSPDQAHADRLTPGKVSSMSRCGVNLFGFDQILPDDGRIAASIWSWAKDKPSRHDGKCAVQRPDGRWITRHCAAKRRAACHRGRRWKLTRHQVPYSSAWLACRAAHARFDLPRTGYENSLLRRAAGKAGVWVRYRLP